jgi:hypothetical protein
MDTNLHRKVAVLAVLTGLAGSYFFALRPWHRTWGATQREQQSRLPGDELVPAASPDRDTTHAITIHAPINEVWPWLAQLGQDRGGFYSFEVLEDLVGCEMNNADRILPGRQSWRVGDKLWMYPSHKMHGMGHALLSRFVPGRVLGFSTRSPAAQSSARYDGSWSFVLEPMAAQETRLLIRSQAELQSSIGGRLFAVLVFEPMHFTMERRMMENIKLLAEGQRVSTFLDNLSVLLWTISAALGIVALVLVFRRAAWKQALLSFGSCAVVFQWLTLGQPSLLLGALVVLILMRAVWSVWRSERARPGYQPHAPKPALRADSLF